MSNRLILCAALAIGAGALGGCATIPVTVDANPGYSVANCHTYAFADEHLAGSDGQSAFGNPLNGDRLRTAIEAQLYSRGIQRVNRNQAECVVGYALGTRQVFDQAYAGWGVGWGYGWRRGWWGYDDPWVYNETRIVIDFFDTRSRKPIWHGAASETFADLTGPNAELKISQAAAAIFARLPIAAAYAPPPGAPPAGAPPPPAPGAMPPPGSPPPGTPPST